MFARQGLAHVDVESRLVRRVLLTLPVLAALVLAMPTARSAEPSSGTLSHQEPAITWTGTVPLQTVAISGVGCDEPAARLTCDTFELTVQPLAGTDADGEPLPDDVLVALATPTVQPGTIFEVDLYVYGPDGTELGRDTNLGSNDTVTLRDVAPGTYTVAVQSPLSTNPGSQYSGSAQVVDAGEPVPVDEETACGFESSPEGREVDAATGQGLGTLAGDPTAAVDGVDRGERIALDVLVLLDGITQAEAEAIFAHAAAETYDPLNIELRVAEYRPVSFVDANGAPLVDGLALIRAAKALLGGERPAGIDVVEVLTGRDIHQLNVYGIAGIADCIGGVAHDDRSFLVAEGRFPGDIAFGPAIFQYKANPHITAHEIGHLLGGQHHYANCVEGIDATDVHDDHVEGSPCTLMFNAADFLGGDFDTLNGAIVRGSVHRYARP